MLIYNADESGQLKCYNNSANRVKSGILGQEGLPPSLGIGLLVAGIFISVELAATLVGFAIFGGYLGLRPAFKKKPTLV